MKRASLIVLALLLVANALVVAFITEGALHPPRPSHAKDVAPYAAQMAPTAQHVTLRASDGTSLDAWFLVPPNGASRAVIVCHGIADSAMGGIGFAPFFLRNGFAVLVPDSRAHGDSGGFNSFGIYESGDIVQWIQWLKAQGATSLYGLGESLGAATLLQSLSRGADFRAIVAECPYATFNEVATDRIAKMSGPFLARILVAESLLYVRGRYHVDLSEAQPLRSVQNTTVPILLIHGSVDTQTYPKHSLEIAHANQKIKLWLVPNAPHVGAYSTAPREFESQVLAWFQR